MEWVETVAKTLAEARELALDRLGVGEEDAEFEVLEEPDAAENALTVSIDAAPGEIAQAIVSGLGLVRRDP